MASIRLYRFIFMWSEKDMKSMLIYGGSFDPPHFGHLKTALAIQQHCQFDHVFFLPCKVPVLKNPTQADPHHRLNMLTLMLTDYPQFEVMTSELDRETPSYMVDTLNDLRHQYGSTYSITLLLGMDAFLEVPRWFQSDKLPGLCNLLIIQRISITTVSDIPPALNHLFPKQCKDARDLKKHAHGAIAYDNAGNIPISSTAIREKVKLGQNIQGDLPDEVITYIKNQGLYQSLGDDLFFNLIQ